MRTILFLFAVLFSVAGYGQQQMLLRGAADGSSYLLGAYPGAYAAFSVRKLSSSYGGNAIRIRRESDDAEVDIGFDGDDLDQSAIVSHCSGTQCKVTIWYDQSGNGNNLTQTTNGDQPTIYTSGAVTQLNSIPALDFSLSDYFLRATGFLIELSVNDVSVSYVGNHDKYILSEGDVLPPSYSSNVIFGSSIAADVLWVNGTTFGGSSAAQAQLGFTYDGSTFQAYLDGSTSGSSGGATVNSEVGSNTIVGARADESAAYFDEKMQELIIYHSVESVTGIAANQNTYFSIY